MGDIKPKAPEEHANVEEICKNLRKGVFSEYVTLLKSIKSIENMKHLNAMTDKQFFELKFPLSYGLKDKIEDMSDSEIHDLISDIDGDEERIRDLNDSENELLSEEEKTNMKEKLDTLDIELAAKETTVITSDEGYYDDEDGNRRKRSSLKKVARKENMNNINLMHLSNLSISMSGCMTNSIDTLKLICGENLTPSWFFNKAKEQVKTGQHVLSVVSVELVLMYHHE